LDETPRAAASFAVKTLFDRENNGLQEVLAGAMLRITAERRSAPTGITVNLVISPRP
jgi:hypothetical protein